MKVEKITKLESAERQLKVSIRLFFRRCDSIAIHTLVGASYQILSDLSQKENIQPIFRDSEFIRPEKKREWNDKINEAINYFKHADRDSHKDLIFRPETTQVLLLDCVYLYQKLTKKLFHEAMIYNAWFILKNPDFLLEDSHKTQAENVLNAGVDINNFDFFSEILENPSKFHDVVKL